MGPQCASLMLVSGCPTHYLKCLFLKSFCYWGGLFVIIIAHFQDNKVDRSYRGQHTHSVEHLSPWKHSVVCVMLWLCWDKCKDMSFVMHRKKREKVFKWWWWILFNFRWKLVLNWKFNIKTCPPAGDTLWFLFTISEMGFQNDHNLNYFRVFHKTLFSAIVKVFKCHLL